MAFDRRAFLCTGSAVVLGGGVGGLLAAPPTEAAVPGAPPYLTSNPFFSPALELVSKGSHPTTAIDFAKGLDPFAVLPVAGLFAQFAEDTRGVATISDPLAPLGAANALAYVVQAQQPQACGKSSPPARFTQLFEIGPRISMPTCKPLTAARAIAAITIFFGLASVAKRFEHDILTAAPGLDSAAKRGPQPFVRALRPALEHEAATTPVPVIRDALVPRLEPLIEDIALAAFSLWLALCR